MCGEDLYILAHKAEARSDWEEAKKYWRLLKSQQDVDACQMIIDAIKAGDEFRMLNESCPVCKVVSSKHTKNCPSCNVDKQMIRFKKYHEEL